MAVAPRRSSVRFMKQAVTERFKILVPLLAGAYLGFYGFALVMGVFSKSGLVKFSIGAAICAAVIGAYLIARRRGIDPIATTSPLARSDRAERERRGF
jgi:hypothetical protein